jgi:hypothetical protein
MATENEFPDWKTVQEVRSFFEQEEEFPLAGARLYLVLLCIAMLACV